MAGDHLDKETSLSVELTETGVKASAKSRLIAAFDRMCGNVLELANVLMERKTIPERARIEGERAIIEAAAQRAVAQIGVDDELARRVIEGQFRSGARAQLNKDGVMREALVDLSSNPPSDSDAQSGPLELDPVFMDRFEQYAACASTEELRARWGRVLASEVRAPGTFNAKVLRATDELDSKAARLFEALMPFRQGHFVLKKLMPPIEFQDQLSLIEAGLVADPGSLGHVRLFGQFTTNGVDYWATSFDQYYIGFPAGISLPYGGEGLVSQSTKGAPAFSVIVLTDVGRALASILPPPNTLTLAAAFVDLLSRQIGAKSVHYWLETQDHRLKKIAGLPSIAE